MIGRAKFNQAHALVQRSDVCAELEARLRPTTVGRPRALRVDVLLTAMLLAFGREQSLALTKVHHLLTRDLPRDLQNELGLIRADGRPITLRQVRYTWGAITEKFEHTEGRRPEMADEVRDATAAAMQSIIDRLISSTSTHVPSTGRYAVDATAIESAARGKRRPRRGTPLTEVGGVGAGAEAPGRPLTVEDQDGATADGDPDARGADKLDAADRVGRCADPDARWGYRTKTYDNKSNLMFGYQVLAYTRVGALAKDAVEPPLLIDRIAVVPGNSHGIDETIACLDRPWAGDVPVVELLADRGFSYSVPANWADKLRARGIEQVLDLHAADHGARVQPDHGYVMVDGWPHCPSMPEHLERIDRPGRLVLRPEPKNPSPEQLAEWVADRDAIAEFDRLIAERRTYRFERTAKAGSRSEQFKCPAKAGKLVCDACPLSQDFVGVPAVTAPAAPGKACTQATITIKASIEPKLRQDLYWGSPEWKKSYSRRTRVEGSFGVLKSPKSGNIRRGWTHQVGLVKTSLLLAIAVAATNLQLLIAWAKRTGNTADPLTQMNTEGHGWVELDEHGRPMAGAGPPA